MKSLVMVADGKPVLALLRGDHQLSETKFAQAAGGAMEVPPRASRRNQRMVRRRCRARSAPSASRTCRSSPISRSKARRNMIAGANKNDYHLRNVTPGRDFKPQFADLRQVADGDPCAVCGSG